MTSNEVTDGTGLNGGTVRAFMVYFRRGGLLDMVESHPSHLYRFSEHAQERNSALLWRIERVLEIVGNPLEKARLPLL